MAQDEANESHGKAAAGQDGQDQARRGQGQQKKAEPDGPGAEVQARAAAPAASAVPGHVPGQLPKEFNYSSSMEIPRVVKISLNMGLGRAAHEAKLIDSAVEELKQIAGQAPVVCKAKKDIANYKLRKGHKIGVMVTLRRERMWEFLDRLCNIALPRVRDFRGVSSKGFDGRGNYTLGVREQIIFPEIEFDKIDAVKGLNISIVTTAKTDNEGRALLAHLGMPFRQAPAQGQAS
ncbi:MAG: 50S ribosomal protein L5 [Myxococcales bacterium]|nr:50S ribosomal protein L5 [Myxococcales bacterium]